MRILGHRGASHEAPENTLAAFELALRQGADGVELDARLCASGEAVVFHDETLERLTGRPGAVRDTPWSVLRTLEVQGAGGKTAPIPLLSLVLERLPRTAWINVELKAERWSDTRVAEVAGALLEAGGHAEHVVVSSFDPRCLLRLAVRFPGFRRGFLLDPDRPMALQTGLYLPLLGRDAVHPAVDHFDRIDVERWHRSGREVAAWTTDDPQVARRLQQWGVDSCITNQPGALRAGLAG
jgi:glycerophosphoryl diester phosphodiesterase